MMYDTEYYRELISKLNYVKQLPKDKVRWCQHYACYGRAAFYFRKSDSAGVGRHKSGYFCARHIVRVLSYSKYEKSRSERAYNTAVNKETRNANQGKIQ
jgi:hypothetical protein